MRGLRAGGPDGPRHRRATRSRTASSPARHLADRSARSTRRSSSAIESDMFRRSYGEVFEGDETWNALPVPEGDRYAWDDDSTYVKRPPYFEGMPAEPAGGVRRRSRARGRSRCSATASRPTTSHRPARSARTRPPGRYLIEHGVEQRDFNSYGSRRGNHEVMMRGTFANVRLRNQLAPGTEGGVTVKDGERDVDLRRRDGVRRGGRAALRAGGQGVRLRLLARLGRQGPAAARRPVRARRELRAHPPLEPRRAWACCRCSSPTASRSSRSASPASSASTSSRSRRARARWRSRPRPTTASRSTFDARVRIDTPNEWLYFRGGGILHFVLRQLRAG